MVVQDGVGGSEGAVGEELEKVGWGGKVLWGERGDKRCEGGDGGYE